MARSIGLGALLLAVLFIGREVLLYQAYERRQREAREGQRIAAEACDRLEIKPTTSEDRDGWARIRGVLENNSDRVIGYAEVGFELRAIKDGDVIASGRTNELTIHPGERRPYEGLIDTRGGLDNWKHVRHIIRACEVNDSRVASE